MNLTFRICWIEDQASNAEVEAVEDAVRTSGFEPEIDRVVSEEEISTFAQRQQHYHDYDLIMLDLTLGTDLRGDDIAPDVRAQFRSTPILFYSAEDENALRRRMADRLVEGVYCAHRNRLAPRVAEFVSDWSPALNRLSGMRGLAAQVVAECDREFCTILRRLAGNRAAEAELVGSLKNRVRLAGEVNLERIDPIASLDDLLADHSISSGVLFEEVRARIDASELDDEVRVIRRALRNYPHQVLNRRNLLAHALEERTADGWRIVRPGTTRNLTVDDFQRYRADFLVHLQSVRGLRDLLVGQQSH